MKCRGCERKIAYPTEKSARIQLRVMKKRVIDADRLTVYQCGAK